MKEKKEIEIATNVSSGAEKVEAVEKRVKTKKDGTQTKTAEKTTVKKSGDKTQSAATAKKSERISEEKIDVKKLNAESTDGKAERESEAAKARVAAALKRKEEQAKLEEQLLAEEKKRAAERKARAEKRAAERKAKAEKRKAERKALAEKAAAERKARAEKRKAEREAQIRERAHGKANRAQAKHKAKKQKSENKNNSRESKRGYGGWLAAVITLGTVTLALSTVVTIGAIDMNRTKSGVMSSCKGTTYELVGIMENVDNDLDRVRLSNSSAQQSRILTDLLVQARLAELDLEKMPIAAETDRNITSFINRVAFESERMLTKLRNGESLSAEDEAALERLYKTNHEVRMQLDEYVAKMTDDDISMLIKKGEGGLADVMQGLEKLTLEENQLALGDKKEEKAGAGMRRNADSGEQEGGFEPKLDPAKAEEKCVEYFADYKISEFQCIGETVSHGMGAYNLQGYDDNGTMLFAEIDYNSGELLRFDYYEDCNEETFDLDNAKLIAENFMEKLGYTDMTAVRVRENGTDSDFTFVYEMDGTVFYPDEVRVKICRTRGVVTGFDATRFLQNHKDRTEPNVKISLAAAQEKLKDGVEVETSRLAVVRAGKEERTAYEFLCSYEGERYFIYTDAATGEEISIVNVKSLG